MSFLHIIHKGRTATIFLEDGKDLLDRYVNMDTGRMSYTMGKQIGGKPINPNGQLGKKLIRLAEDWIDNPNTEWKAGSSWIEPLYGKKKTTIRSTSTSLHQSSEVDESAGCAIIFIAIMILIFLVKLCSQLF